MGEKRITDGDGLEVINLGLSRFAEAVRSQGVSCVHVNWRPPAGGDPELIEVLDRLRSYYD